MELGAQDENRTQDLRITSAFDLYIGGSKQILALLIPRKSLDI